MKEFIVVPGCLWDGVSGAVAEDRAVLVRDGVVRRIGIPDCFGMSAPYPRLMELNGITSARIVETAHALLK